MFKLRNMSNNNLTHRSNKWPNHSFNKEEFEEDSVEGSEVEVVNQSSATPMDYLGIIRGSSLMRNVHNM